MAVLDNADLRSSSIAAAGTTQADATSLRHKHVMVPTITAGAGVVLQEQFCAQTEEGTIHNSAAAAGAASTGQALLVYPWSGASFNGQAANAALTLPAGKGCRWVYFNATTIGIVYA